MTSGYDWDIDYRFISTASLRAREKGADWTLLAPVTTRNSPGPARRCPHVSSELLSSPAPPTQTPILPLKSTRLCNAETSTAPCNSSHKHTSARESFNLNTNPSSGPTSPLQSLSQPFAISSIPSPQTKCSPLIPPCSLK